MTCAILIEDDLLDAQVEEITLKQVGFQVIHAASLLDGETHSMTLLDRTRTPLPTVIILDLRLPHPSNPALEGTTLAAALTRRMQAQMIHPASIVALTNYISQEREEEAIYAGCQRVFTKPLTSGHAHWIWQQTHEPIAQSPTSDLGMRLYQHKAEEILAIVRRGQPPHVWSEDDAQLVLCALTGYPQPSTIDQIRQGALLLTLGGHTTAASLLQHCAIQLDEPYNHILQAFLSGETRRTIRCLLIDKGYSRTHSYYCINALPSRVSMWLQEHLASYPRT
ncbi:MAG: response regulator [Chloroflexota bacterium]